MIEEKKALLKQIAHLTTLPKKSSPLQWEFEEAAFGIYGFKTTFKGSAYYCFFDPAEGYSLSIYKEGKEISELNIQGFCYKTHFETIFDRAQKQCPQAIAAYQKRKAEERKHSQQKVKQIEQKEVKKINEALKNLSQKE